MSRIVFAWEMGNNHGHLWRLLPIALRLQAQGHEVSFVLKPMVSAQRYLAPHGIRWYPCPTLLAPIDLGREITTYADILAAQGASSPDLLRGIVHAWENLFSLLQADIIVIEHAPFALLAAKRAGIRTVQVGTGFTIPPTLSPAPCFRPWAATAVEAGKRTQIEVERAIQSLFDRQQSLTELLTADYTCLLTLRELDHYAALRDPEAVFLGAVPEPEQGERIEWQSGDRPHLFVYLYRQKWIEAVLKALSASGAEVIAVIPDLDVELSERYGKTLRLYRRPVQLTPLLAGCALALTHGGHGSTLNCLLAGVPMLVLPLHIEQLLVTERLRATGAGMGILPNEVTQRIDEVLPMLLRSQQHQGAARAVAERYRGVPRERALEDVVGLIEDELAKVGAATGIECATTFLSQGSQ